MIFLLWTLGKFLSMLLILLLLLLLLFMYSISIQSQKTTITGTDKLIPQSSSNPSLGDAIWLYTNLQRLGFSPLLASFCTAQCAFESGNFNSSLYKRCGNFCGMRLAQTDRQKKLLGGNFWEDNGYACYLNKYYCLEDYVDLLRSYYPNALQAQTLDLFCSALKSKGYFGAPLITYKLGCKKYYLMYEDMFKENIL